MKQPPTYTPAGDATRSVAAHVLASRRARGWSLRELSERLKASGWNMTYDALNRIEANVRNGKHVRRVTVDDLVALAQVFGADPADWLSAHECHGCGGAPPSGYTCNECGATS